MSNEAKYCFDTLEPKVAGLYAQAGRLKKAAGPIFISGGSGTGKSSLARLFNLGPGTSPFQVVNCSAIGQDLLARELFGTGPASEGASRLAGKIELAAGGLVLIEEAGEMALALQQNLVRVLPYSRFVFTSTSSLEGLAASDKILPQLSELFAENRLEIPPLSDRSKDIALLSDFFLAELAHANAKQVRLSPEVYHYLCRKRWEGNVRELKNFITRLYYLTDKDVLTVRDVAECEGELPKAHHEAGGDLAHLYPMPLYELEKRYILESIAINEGNKSRTARMLKISLKTLRNKLKEYGAAADSGFLN